METIKIFSRTGYVIDLDIVKGIVINNCSFSMFNSESDLKGIDRKNIVRNFQAASAYRDEKDYSIFMDDDVKLGKDAIPALLAGLINYDIATLPVNDRYSKVQHAVMIIKNKILDEYEIETFNLNFCNQCVYIAHLIDKYNKKINALEGPMQYTKKRSILKKRIKK